MLKEVDAIIQEYVDGRGPGMAVAVIKDGKVLHCKGYGLAQLEWQCPITPETIFPIASLTKPFTATSILLLEQQGKLRLHDPLTRYLPHFPAYGRDITLAHLLTHTSGVKSYMSLKNFWTTLSKMDLSPVELFAYFKDGPLETKPGTHFAYNNSGYHLLGMIIEAVSGLSYEQFIATEIFQKLGMHHSRYMHAKQVMSLRAYGYHFENDIYTNAPYISMTIPYAAGGLGSTLHDLILWDRALREERLLEPAIQQQMYSPVVLPSGEPSPYGLGWFLLKYNQHNVALHGGGVPGFSHLITRFLDDRFTIILLTNCASFSTQRHLITRRIYRAVYHLDQPTYTPVSLQSPIYDAVSGIYETSDGETLAVSHSPNHLLVNSSFLCPLALVPIGEATFASLDDEIVIQFDQREEPGFKKITVYEPLNLAVTGERKL